MNKSRKTSHILNVFQYDEITGAVTLPSTLSLTAPSAGDNSSKVATTAWARTFVASLSYLTSGTTTTSDIGEGTNLYYTQSRFNTAFGLKTTTDLTEGTNLYYTDSRVGTYLTNNSYATQSYVGTQLANLVAAAPATLDTLNELAAALGNDPSFATTVSTSIGTKVPQTRTLTINGTAYDLSADRAWTITSMIYPGAGIAVSTGTAWGTSITDNSTNWNTAYGWGNHASAGYLTSAIAATTYASLTGAYANPAFVASLAYSKITGVPAFLTSYTETDPYRVTAVAVSGTSTKTITITRADASTVTTTWTDIDTDTNTYVTSAAFSGGTLTLTRNDAGTVSVSLDGRYYLASNPSGYITGITSSMVTTALGYTPYNSTNPNGYITGITSSNVTTALGYTPYNSSNPSGYITSSALSSYLPLSGGTLSGTLSLNSYSFSGDFGAGKSIYFAVGYTSTRGINFGWDTTNDRGFIGSVYNGQAWKSLDLQPISGSVLINGFTAWHSGNLTNLNQLSNGPGYITGISSANVTTALGFTPYNSTNPSGYITGITSSNVTTALGYTPYNSSNPAGYVTTSGLSTDTDSEQTIGGRIHYFNSGVGRMNADPRWNESGYDADLGCLHIWSWTAAGVAYGRAGIALYNGSAYQYLTTQNGQGNIYVNNNAILHTSNYSSYALPLSGGTMSGNLVLKSISGVAQTVPNNHGAYLHLGAWAVARTAADAVLVNTAYRADYATDLFDMNISRFTNNSGYLTSVGIGNMTDVHRLFNNMGNNHGTYQDFNSVGNFGVRYMQGSTNGPESGQHYGFTLGLGNDYSYGTYATQFYWLRNTTNPYIRIRYQEGGSWGSWTKTSAAYADSAGSLSSMNISQFTNNSGYVTSSHQHDTLYWSGSARLYTGSDGTRNTGWAYHNDNGTGIHWPNNGWHIYPINASDMYIRSGASDCSLKFTKSGTSGSYIHCAADNAIGFLTTGRSWSLRVDDSGGGTFYGGLTVKGPIYIDANEDLYLNYNYGCSVVGVYASTRFQGVYSMGNAYKLSRDGTTPGNLYGLAWSHPNAGGQAGYLDNHGLLVMLNGTTYSAISNSIWARGDVTAYSDARVKTNIEVVENAIEKIKAIRGVTFNRTDMEHDTKRHAGVIAQEVLAVLPEVVTTTQDGMHSVAYGNLAALFIEAIKEQQKEIDELKSLINGLTK